MDLRSLQKLTIDWAAETFEFDFGGRIVTHRIMHQHKVDAVADLCRYVGAVVRIRNRDVQAKGVEMGDKMTVGRHGEEAILAAIVEGRGDDVHGRALGMLEQRGLIEQVLPDEGKAYWRVKTKGRSDQAIASPDDFAAPGADRRGAGKDGRTAFSNGASMRNVEGVAIEPASIEAAARLLAATRAGSVSPIEPAEVEPTATSKSADVLQKLAASVGGTIQEAAEARPAEVHSVPQGRLLPSASEIVVRRAAYASLRTALSFSASTKSLLELVDTLEKTDLLLNTSADFA
jgi:hypothetical protein